MIKIMLKRRKESDTYLAADRRHRRSTQIVMKATHFIHFHRDLRTPAMSSVSYYLLLVLITGKPGKLNN